MTTVKWEALKMEAKKKLLELSESNGELVSLDKRRRLFALIESVGGSVSDGNGANRKTSELIKEALALIDEWNILCAMKLVKAFPEVLPLDEKISSFELSVDKSDGEWQLSFKEAA